MTVSRRLRFEILKRDNYTCRYCGAKAPDAVLEVDHVIPTALGGASEPTNLATSCEDCNGGKSSVHPDSGTVEDVASDALRWKRAMEAAQSEHADAAALASIVQDRFKHRWTEWNGWGSGPVLPDDWRDAITRLLNAGLTLDDLLAKVNVTTSARKLGDPFAYFCGCCWRQVAQLQERARQIIEDGES